MHEMLTILTDVHGVCQSVCHAAALAVYTTCCVRGVIRCSLCQMLLASCSSSALRKTSYTINSYLYMQSVLLLCNIILYVVLF